jgi:tRNA A-37 threonylcarbamoyl transferase component Bud32
MASDSIPEWMNVKIINGEYSEGKGGWAELFEYGGIRYNALLRPSVDRRGVQDGLLRLLAKACEEDDDRIDDYGDECRRLIWPLIKHDYASRTQPEKTDLSPTKKAVSIEGRTMDGELQAFSHTRKLGYRTKPIPNTFSTLPTFPHTLVHRLERLDDEIFKVEYEGRQYCLKTVHSKEGGSGLKREITTLQRCHHPHIIPIRGIVVNDSNNVEGMLTEVVPNPITLDHVDFTHFSKEQCNLWMSQIRSAVQYLHDKCLVWGDAKPANILIRPDNDLVLVDFAGGATEEWVDSKKMNTQEGDIQALDRIEQFLQRKVVGGGG